MRALFLVAAKLLGLLALYWGLATTVQLAFAVSVALQAVSGETKGTWWLVATLSYSVLTFAFAWLLLFRTEQLANFVRLTEPDVRPGWPPALELLGTGIVLLGLYMLIFSLPSLVRQIVQLVQHPSHLGWDVRNVANLLAPGLQLALSLLLVRRPDAVLSFLGKDARAARPSSKEGA